MSVRYLFLSVEDGSLCKTIDIFISEKNREEKNLI